VKTKKVRHSSKTASSNVK